ncbi:PREDICTED: colipase-like protein 1 [Propithecus coquereli]|uniref:colipase-like protein 1 n=1 Tax=Propithecus coquereli TaxID=379532 RepID=UPI00063ED655|nr:PREDICTED: colipase-like protein 1 [Propithecus coquereli]
MRDLHSHELHRLLWSAPSIPTDVPRSQLDTALPVRARPGERSWRKARAAGGRRAGGGAVGASRQELREIFEQNKSCKSQCCRREPHGCEFHCAEKGSEGSLCHTQGGVRTWGEPAGSQGKGDQGGPSSWQGAKSLYSECPCKPNLTWVFPKNEKSPGIIYGRCQKIEKKKPAKKMFF